MHVVLYIETSLLRAILVEVSHWCLPTSPLYLLHGKLERGFAIRELHSNAGALNFSHNIVQLLRLLQHFPVAAAKLPKHTVGYVGDAVCRVAQRAPQSLKHERTFIEAWPGSKCRVYDHNSKWLNVRTLPPASVPFLVKVKVYTVLLVFLQGSPVSLLNKQTYIHILVLFYTKDGTG